ncbi:MAG: PPOX class F420-dependent oxidoreductase [Actinomycetota bacterium]|nr:PPOX class F420-dependent oxidoreductase [Actinomycetota bacterium]
MAEPIEGRARELLEAPNFCHVATLRRDGSPHLNPVWVDVEDGLVVLNSAEGRAWPANARRDPRVTLSVMNLENPYEYVEIRGRVVEDTHEGADEHIDRMAMKYLGQETYPFRAEGEQRLILRIEPERVHHYSPGG